MADDVVGWVSGPTERGTLALVWSCVITIFACTWTVLHLNVPGRKDTSLTVTLRKLKWMVINILFPEFVFSKAVCDLRLALQELREFDDQLRRYRETIEWNTRSTRFKLFDKTPIMQCVWEIDYPDGWSGLLYDLLRLDRPPHLLKRPAESVIRKYIPFRRFLRRCIVGPPSVSTNPENTALGLEDRQPMEGLETEEHPQTGDAGASSRYKPFQEQDTVPAIMQDRSTSTRITSQQWTVVHSYYAQMGGLAFSGKEDGTNIITASHLTWRYGWHYKDLGHPLMHLVLRKDDIQDKSKADWLLKSLAVLQVTWIIINVIVRYVTGLPVSQIELATVAFAIMAVLIYLANWWKPKDISQPTILKLSEFSGKHLNVRERKQSFTQRILSPAKAIDKAERGVPEPNEIERVANDVLWLEGDTPLLFYLMAGSSFIFGALHCLGWNFEFPTRIELICWRVASLASAILPIITLAVSTILGRLVASKTTQSQIMRKVEAEFELILPDGPRRSICDPTFRVCSMRALDAVTRMPKQSRNWGNLKLDLMMALGERNDHNDLSKLAKIAFNICPTFGYNMQSSLEGQADIARDGKKLLQKPEVLELWSDYEDFVRGKYPNWIPAVAAGGGAETTCLYQILDVVEKISTQAITFKKRADQASNLVSIPCFILYAASRLIILVLCFTSLRAAPARLYQDNVWTRFLPKIS